MRLKSFKNNQKLTKFELCIILSMYTVSLGFKNTNFAITHVVIINSRNRLIYIVHN